jgi:hypothetical protein
MWCSSCFFNFTKPFGQNSHVSSEQFKTDQISINVHGRRIKKGSDSCHCLGDPVTRSGAVLQQPAWVPQNHQFSVCQQIKKEVTPAISLATLSQEVAQFSNSQLGLHRQDARTMDFECSMKSKR